MKTSLAGSTPEEIATQLDVKPFQGRQIFRWIHKKQAFDFESMTDLSKPLRERLISEFAATPMELVQTQISPRTGTKKVLLRLPDEETVESVLIRDKDRVTLCVSSQVGCPLKCDFCATGMAGFKRNLTPAEIVGQALYLLRDEGMGERTPNIVYMGMGEPFRNYDNVIKSIRLLMSKEGLGIAARKITVSTVGEVENIVRFAEEDWQVRLSVSLHAANDALRSKLVPLNRKYPLERLREAIAEYQEKSGRQITFEWTLLDGVNDTPQDMKELREYAHGLQAAVNFIPWNPVSGLPYRPSPMSRCRECRDTMTNFGIHTTLRAEKGQDIDAACGQLRRIHLN